MIVRQGTTPGEYFRDESLLSLALQIIAIQCLPLASAQHETSCVEDTEIGPSRQGIVPGRPEHCKVQHNGAQTEQGQRKAQPRVAPHGRNLIIT